MTDVSYKILMSLIGREMKKHITENKIGKFEQAGFTKGGFTKENAKEDSPKRMLKREKNQLKKDRDKKNISEIVIRKKY